MQIIQKRPVVKSGQAYISNMTLADNLRKFNYKSLIHFTKQVLVLSGMERKKAKVVAETLMEADLMGHSTHGLQLLKVYVSQLQQDLMTKEGEPEWMKDLGSAITWNGRYLPGPWLVHEAIDIAFERIKDHPVVTMVIQKSHHIGCLAAYPERATKKGLVMLLSCSDPRSMSIAPFGGTRGTYSPNPLAAGFPTESVPIIFDVSMSTTANGLVFRSQKEGKKLPGKWLQKPDRELSDDPNEFFTDPPATILPLGGQDAGYKGFALGIMIEAMTNALGGYGRSDNPDQWGASVFLQIIDPGAFGGLEFFKREMQYFADICHSAGDEKSKVRMPGERALQLKKEQMEHGVELYPTIIPDLEKLAEEFSIDMPD